MKKAISSGTIFLPAYFFMDPIDDPDSGYIKTDCLIAADPCPEQIVQSSKILRGPKMFSIPKIIDNVIHNSALFWWRLFEMK